MTAQLDMAFTARPKRQSDPHSQKSRVLVALVESGVSGICVSDLPLELGYCARNRLSEWRREGVAIHSERCRVHKHRGLVYRYWLGETPYREVWQ